MKVEANDKEQHEIPGEFMIYQKSDGIFIESK